MRYIPGAVCIVAGVGVLTMSAVNAQTTPPPPYKTVVGVMVDSKTGDTTSSINCFTEGSDGRFQTVNGDGTLIMDNRNPHTMICYITIKRVTTT